MLDTIQNNSGIFLSVSDNNVADLISIVLPYVYGIAGIILLFNIIASGYHMMTSAGDPKAMQSAQAKLTTSVIGILILFISFWVVRLIGQFLGIELFDQIFGTGGGRNLPQVPAI